MKNRRDKIDPRNMPIEISPYDGEPNPRNPFDRLTPEERHKKIVEIYAKIYLKITDEKERKKSSEDFKSDAPIKD
jgi:hypothetical protein